MWISDDLLGCFKYLTCCLCLLREVCGAMLCFALMLTLLVGFIVGFCCLDVIVMFVVWVGCSLLLL